MLNVSPSLHPFPSVPNYIFFPYSLPIPITFILVSMLSFNLFFLGFPEKEVDTVKELLFGNLYLLMLTFFVSAFHVCTLLIYYPFILYRVFSVVMLLYSYSLTSWHSRMTLTFGESERLPLVYQEEQVRDGNNIYSLYTDHPLIH